MPELLEGAVRHYEWGSPEAIPEFLGRPADGRPWAELWLGAHPLAPAAVGSLAVPLDRRIAADPPSALGPAAASRFGGLPFLLKVLAATRPLSLQAHPSPEQARIGFEREQALGIPMDAPHRSFRDPFHKPELVCALTRFEALCGLRDAAATLALLDALEAAELDPVRERLRADSSPDGLRYLIGWLLGLGEADAAKLIGSLLQACSSALAAAGPGRPDADARTPADGQGLGVAGSPAQGDRQRPALTPARSAEAERPLWQRQHEGLLSAVISLGRSHPGDPAVVVAMLLNHVVLQPGEALFLPAGNLHCYLGGTVVEVMSCSDNVLRGGLTAKHVDVETLLNVVDTTPAHPAIQRPEPVGGVAAYESGVPEFALKRLEVEPRRPVALRGGPAVLLCTEGAVDVGGLALERGLAAWVDFSEFPVELAGSAAVFACTTGLT